MGKIRQVLKIKGKYRKSKTTKGANGRRRCKSCGRFL